MVLVGPGRFQKEVSCSGVTPTPATPCSAGGLGAKRGLTHRPSGPQAQVTGEALGDWHGEATLPRRPGKAPGTVRPLNLPYHIVIASDAF